MKIKTENNKSVPKIDNNSINELQEVESSKPKELESEIPKDRYNLIVWIMFFLGLVHFLPAVFFTNATDYWMYKFRNTSLNESMQNNADYRTVMQAQFASIVSVVSSVALVVSSLFITFFGHRFKALLKIAGPIIIIIICLGFHIGFVFLDTDSWQFSFFVVVITSIAIVFGVNTIFGMAMYEPISKLPDKYLKSYLLGQGLAAIFTTMLQILSLASGGSILQSALIYSIIAFVMMILGLLSYLFVRKLDFYKYYMKHSENAKASKKSSPSLTDIKEIVWALRYPFLTMIVFLLTMKPSYPAIGNLVVSENKGSGSAWSDIYFVPICSFLLHGVADFVGRGITSLFKIRISDLIILLLATIRGVLVIFGYMFSNAKPRSHLPVLLEHDYEYILVVIFAGVTGGILFSLSYLSIPRLCPKDKTELGYILVTFVFSLGMMIFSFLGPLAVYCL